MGFYNAIKLCLKFLKNISQPLIFDLQFHGIGMTQHGRWNTSALRAHRWSLSLCVTTSISCCYTNTMSLQCLQCNANRSQKQVQMWEHVAPAFELYLHLYLVMRKIHMRNFCTWRKKKLTVNPYFPYKKYGKRLSYCRFYDAGLSFFCQFQTYDWQENIPTMWKTL